MTPSRLTIRKHNWVYECTQTMHVCTICGQLSGQGFSPSVPCTERFDMERFEKWLEFGNWSLIRNKMKVKYYVKRYSEQILSRTKLLRRYEEMNGEEPHFKFVDDVVIFINNDTERK